MSTGRWIATTPATLSDRDREILRGKVLAKNWYLAAIGQSTGLSEDDILNLSDQELLALAKSLGVSRLGRRKKK